tara:strand:- start:2291 stop:2629 length:339 start_codon:yes stop_codon:yes gene_type:complete
MIYALTLEDETFFFDTETYASSEASDGEIESGSVRIVSIWDEYTSVTIKSETDSREFWKGLVAKGAKRDRDREGWMVSRADLEGMIAERDASRWALTAYGTSRSFAAERSEW